MAELLTPDQIRQVGQLIKDGTHRYDQKKFRSDVPPADNQVEQWNSTDGRWVPVTLTGIAGTVTIEDDNVVQGIASSLDFGNGLTATSDGTEAEISVNESEISHDNIGGVSADDHHDKAHAGDHAKGGADDLEAQTVEVTSLETPVITPDSDTPTDNIQLRTNQSTSSSLSLRSWDGSAFINVLNAVAGIPIFLAKAGSAIIMGSDVTVQAGKKITVDTIDEVTGAAGVTIDGVVIKDTTVDLNGTADAIILDADGDTTISAPTDDQIDFELGGLDALRFNYLAGNTDFPTIEAPLSGQNMVFKPDGQFTLLPLNQNTAVLGNLEVTGIVTASDFQPGDIAALGDSTTEVEVVRQSQSFTESITGDGSMRVSPTRFSKTTNTDFEVEIDGTGMSLIATFKWSNNGGGSYVATGVQVGLGSITLENGVKVNFDFVDTGSAYDVGDKWTWTSIGTDNQKFMLRIDSTNSDVAMQGNLRMLTDGSSSASAAGVLAFGAGNDALIYYDGTDLIIEPAKVGSGDVYVKGGSVEFDDTEGIRFGTGKDAIIAYNGIDLVFNPAVVGNGTIVFTSSLFLIEAAAASSSTATRGQFWVKDDAPNKPKFTDDAGSDFDLATNKTVQDSSHTFAVDAEGSDTYVITLTPALVAYAAGQVFHFDANTVNTGVATLNVNGLGAKTIKKNHDVDLANGDIEAGQHVTVIYDGTNFQMQSQLGNAAGGGGDVASDVIWDAAGDLAVADGANSAVKLTVGSAPASNTTPSSLQSQWASVTGDARKVLTVSASGTVSWESLKPFDVTSPAQMLSFSDGLSSSIEIASSGTVTPTWTCTYEPSDGCTALNIDVSSTGIDPDVSGSDYPLAAGAGAGDPYTAPTGEIAIKKETTTVGAITTWTADATVSGDDVANLTTTIRWLNNRMWGESAVDDIDTEAEIDTFMLADGTQELALTTATTKAITVNGSTEYIYFMYRSALSDPTFFDDDTGLGFDMTLMGEAISWTNDSGFAENYDIWRSTEILIADTYNLRVEA